MGKIRIFGAQLWGNPAARQKLRFIRLGQNRLSPEKHYSPRMEKSYVFWIRQFILFHNKQRHKDVGQEEIEAYLNHLAAKCRVSAST